MGSGLNEAYQKKKKVNVRELFDVLIMSFWKVKKLVGNNKLHVESNTYYKICHNLINK